MRRLTPVVVLLGSMIWAGGMADPVRDRIAAEALKSLEAEIADCWGHIDEQLPMILYCGSADTSDLKPIRQALDGSILGQDEVSKAKGRWLWKNQREYLGRIYDTEPGDFEARIYLAKRMVAVGYRIDFSGEDVEVASCDEPQLREVFEQIPQYDKTDPEFRPHVQTRQVPAVYPELALTVRMKGKVDVQARIAADGSVSDVCVADSNRPNFGFEAAAVAAVMTWKYEPAQYQGRPVESILSTTVEFAP